MAIYHFSVSTISRAKGRSATAAAAYRAGDYIYDERTDQIFDYSRRKGVVWKGLVDGNQVRPPYARERFWNAVESAEKRSDAKVAREIVIALPGELSLDENIRLARGMALWIRERHGIAIDIAVHAPDAQGDQRNIHAHLLLSTRRYDGTEFGEKAKELDRRPESRTHICAWRKEWERRANRALAKAGRAERISCMSLKEAHQRAGLPPVEPCEHLGPARTQMERRGYRTQAGNRNRARISERRERAGFVRERMELGCKISEEEREYYRTVVRPEKKVEEEDIRKASARPQRASGDEVFQIPPVAESEVEEADECPRSLSEELSDTIAAIWEPGGFTRAAPQAILLIERAKTEHGPAWQKRIRDSLSPGDRRGLAATLRHASIMRNLQGEKLMPKRLVREVGRFIDFLDRTTQSESRSRDVGHDLLI